MLLAGDETLYVTLPTVENGRTAATLDQEALSGGTGRPADRVSLTAYGTSQVAVLELGDGLAALSRDPMADPNDPSWSLLRRYPQLNR